MNKKNIKSSSYKFGDFKPIKWIIILCVVLLMAACTKLKPPKLDPVSEEFYNYARYLLTRHEDHIFRNLTTKEAREKFIENFWAIRDPNPDSEENEFKEEIKKRYEYVVKYLRETYIPGWKTDRGMIYIVLGPPLDIQRDTVLTNSRMIGYIQWYYGYNVANRLFIRFIDHDGDGTYQIDPNFTSLDLLNALDDLKYQVLKKEDNVAEKTKLKFKLEYKSSENNFYILVEPKYVTFEKSEGKVIAKFRINLVVYRDNKEFSRYSQVKTLKMREEELTGSQAKIVIVFPLRLEKGKYKVDALINDVLGEKSKKRFFAIKVK